MTQQYRLVVLFGGESAEHDVSCVTARHVVCAVDTDRFAIDAIGITREGEWRRTTTGDAIAAGNVAELPAALETTGDAVEPLGVVKSDGLPVVVLPLLHGPMGEDGTVQGLLDLAGVPYVGSGVLGSALCMDKAMAKQATAGFGIAQAKWRTVHADDITASLPASLMHELGDVTFVKPANMGSSVGVSRSTNGTELADALRIATNYDEWVIIEEAVKGREIEVGVLGNRTLHASVPGEIVPGDEFYSYDDKYHDGVAQTLIPAVLSDEATAEVRALACRVGESFRVQGLARIDFFYEEHGRGFLLNEVNTMPGFTPISMFPKLWEATGVDYPELITRLVDLAIERHDKRLAHRSLKHEDLRPSPGGT
jgi:D-alanine-D-alanine ligase